MSLASPGAPAVRQKLGDILIESGAITPLQLEHALTQQRILSQRLGQTLVTLGYLTDDTMRRGLAEQLGVLFLDLEKTTLDRRLARAINRSYARRQSLVPVSRRDGRLTVAMDDPGDARTIEELRQLTAMPIQVVTASATSIQRAFRRLYEEPVGPAAPADLPGATSTSVSRGEVAAQLSVLDEQGSRRADDLFWKILQRALEVRTSDIHLELLPAGLRVRFRVDGVLREPHLPAFQQAFDRGGREIVSRIKVLSELDIAERRRPQDGSFQVTVNHRGMKTSIDLRVSVIPSHSGESVVIRILNRSSAPRSFGELDLSPTVARELDRLLSRPTGIFLVTGPTGSGKSTTLYACLMKLHRPEIRILTAEDPVEYVYDELSQSQVNDAIGNTFANYLRAFLRHDPEVIMVGEIRDEDTAEMAFRAAQTGHLLLSTLHTNSALAALPRLLDLQVESSLIASSLIGVISQRLLRKICDRCHVEAAPPPALVAEFFGDKLPNMAFHRGAGCAACGFSGYRGRMLIADLWVPDETDLMLVARRVPFDEIRQSASRTTFTMAQDAHERLLAGRTTLQELMRVLPYPVIVEHRQRALSGTQGT
jgi:type IV pilus assembly protein PilB